jgi:hypothetical protein
MLPPINKESEEWWQIVIEDESALSGESLIRLLKLVSPNIEVHFVAVDDIEGGGAGISRLMNNGAPLVLSLQAVLDSAESVVQFDWGDFFLFQNKEQALQVLPGEPYSDSVCKALVTVRAVDDTYFYVYTRSQDLVEAILEKYSEAEVWKSPLKKLEFPY